jgi:hypothetical protein
MGDGGDRLLRAFPLVDFSDELPSIALSVGDGRAAPVTCARTGLLPVGRTQVLWQLVHQRGAWQLVLGRLRLFKPYQDNEDGAEDGRRPGDLERACETSAVSVLLPGDYSGGAQELQCCAAASLDGTVLVVYALLASESGARLFRLELRLPPDAAPFDPASGLANGLQPTHDMAVVGRVTALDAVGAQACVYGTDHGQAVAVCFHEHQASPHVVPLGEGGAGMLAFFGRGQTTSAIVMMSACLSDSASGIVSAVHADGKVAVWQLAVSGPAPSSQFLFQQHLDMRGLRVTKSVGECNVQANGTVRILVAATTDGNTTVATLWDIDPDRRYQPKSVPIDSPPADGDMLGVQVIGENQEAVVVFLMRSAADKLVLLYRERQASDSNHWMRGLVSDADSTQAASPIEDPCLLSADLESGKAGNKLVIASHTCLLLVVWDSFHPLEVETAATRPLARLARTLYRGLTDEDDFARCRQEARASFAGQLQTGEQRPLQIAMSALAGLKKHSHDEAVNFLCHSDGSVLAAVFADIDSLIGHLTALPAVLDNTQSGSEQLLCGALQRQYCKRIGESRLDIAQDMLFCLAYMLRHRLAVQSLILPTTLQQQYIVRVDQLVRANMAICYLAGRKFADDGTDLEERFSSLRIALPCKYILGSCSVWRHVGSVDSNSGNPRNLVNRLEVAWGMINRAVPMAPEQVWSSGVSSLVKGLCCNDVNRPEVADKLLQLLGADAGHMEDSAIQWRVEINKTVGQSYARLNRFADARRHFLGAAKSLLLAPVAQFAAEDCDVNILAEIDEMMDALEQDPASALELSSLALRIEAYVESTLQEETGWKARLLSKTFGYALKIKDVECAYHAMTSNPDREKRTNSLKMLVHALHKSKQLEILFEKPLVAAPARFSGTGSRNAVGVCLQGEVASILLERARAGGDEYFKSLYAFHAKQQNMQKAAEAMYALAERFTASGAKNNDTHDYGQAADYLMVAISSLRMCPESVRWIERQHRGTTFDLNADRGVGKGAKRKLAKAGFHSASLFNEDTPATGAELTGSTQSETVRDATSESEYHLPPPPLHITALEGEHALLTAR